METKFRVHKARQSLEQGISHHDTQDKGECTFFALIIAVFILTKVDPRTVNTYGTEEYVQYTRFIQTDGRCAEECLYVDNFNSSYDFKYCFAELPQALPFVADATLIVIRLPLSTLAIKFSHFQKRDLVQMGHLHGLHIVDAKKTEMYAVLNGHRCTQSCGDVVYVFKARSKPRRAVPSRFYTVLKGIAPRPPSKSMPEPSEREALHAIEDRESDVDEEATTDHLTKVGDLDKLRIIAAWEKKMNKDKIGILVCCVCGKRVMRSETTIVDGKTIDLSLLRNDELPEAVRPMSYNFVAYDRAILNPKGLSNRERVGDMTMCHACHGGLMFGNMPKFALSNWLYYGRDTLPDDIKLAFAEASMFERMLVSRARCNSICCKFRVSEDNNTSKNGDHTQKGIRGNIMVAPLDAITLHSVLPPKIDARDTMTAVIVGQKMPTKETISKLGPVLVRKSRVKKLLDFLMAENPFYAPGDDFSFSQDNLEAIHGSGSDGDIPKTVVIGQMSEQDAIENINADYTPRNEEEWIKADRMHELVIENVGYTNGDHSPEAYSAMKALALQRCMSGKPFLVSGTGSRMLPDFNNPSILTWLFPHLDPWGIGGFYENRRSVKLSMKEQLSHLLCSDDVLFEQDSEFAFVFYNVLQKADVSRNIRFRVPKTEQSRIISELKAVDTRELGRLCNAISSNPTFRPDDPEQKRIMALLQSVTMTTHGLPGSNGYKMTMRRNVRAIINGKGTPTLFITLNPSDVHHPIVRMFGGDDVDLDAIADGQDLQAWRRKIYAAKNPSACAKFFDLMVTTFIEVVLGYGKEESGLYGRCDAYYGVVEAQGKGTLHLHLLVWLRGHHSPQVLRDKLRSSPEYRHKFVEWLESIVMNEFPVLSSKREDDPSRAVRIRSKDLGEPHPGTIAGPSLLSGQSKDMTKFWTNYKQYLIRLLNEYNWHEHTGTCWKYLKRGEEKNDKNCRMRMDGRIHPQTIFDQETGDFRLRRLHPWVSSYTDVVTFIMKCNMNIQFIGTGAEAKAFVYYVTDYVTKPSLPIQAGLAALSYAVKKMDTAPAITEQSSDQFNASALTRFVNSMMGKQEISHQQVMSYLVGGGDCYTSERFHNLHMSSFLRYISNQIRSYHGSANYEDGGEGDQQPDESVYLSINEDGAQVDNQVSDYLLRPTSEPYNGMSLYDFIARTSKSKVRNKDHLAESRHAFSSWSHPQRATHKLSLRTKHVLPVILGPSLPSRGTSDETPDFWSEYMLILFKPWRTVQDLKANEATWAQAFNAFESNTLKKRHKQIMQNMQVLSECAAARFKAPGPNTEVDVDVTDSVNNRVNQESDAAVFTEEEDIQQWKAKYCSDVFSQFDENEPQNGVHSNVDSSSSLKETLGRHVTDALDFCLQIREGDQRGIHDSFMRIDVEEPSRDDIEMHNIIMKRKRKRATTDDEDSLDTRIQKRQHVMPFVDIETIPLYSTTHKERYDRIVQGIVDEMNLRTNAEQLEAFMTVARHVGERDPGQLLMFVSGVGGTGKSHVIKSIVKLFEKLNRRKSLLLGAPTGSAAVLIGGSTLHSLILENPNGDNKKNTAKLARIWNGITDFIVDEVSMLSATFMSRLSDAMRQAKGDDPNKSRQIFGGVNVIFMGDFCQLKPPGEYALFASQIIKKLTKEMADKDDISSMNGVFLWRQVTRVIELVKNCRHAADPTYSDFLSRLRVGKCQANNSNGGADGDDYDYLQSRLITNIYKKSPEELAAFNDAPIIVGTKQMRDMLNARLATFHASRLKKDIRLYYAKDSAGRKPVPAGSAEYLWNLQSSHVRDAPGRLPLFEGMKVMVTENIAFDSKVVNGTEGIVRRIMYEEDEHGRRYATVVYIYVPGIGFHIEGLEEDVVPIFPARTNIKHRHLNTVGIEAKSFSRYQLPLIPAYAFTDFKSEGRTMSKAMVDIASARGQGVYVMLSRVMSLSGVVILRWFSQAKIYHHLSAELREELTRLGLRC